MNALHVGASTGCAEVCEALLMLGKDKARTLNLDAAGYVRSSIRQHKDEIPQ